MPRTIRVPRPPARVAPLAVALLLVAMLAGPATAAAQDTKISLDGPAAKALRAAGVRIDALAPATASGTRVALPTGAVTVATRTATVEQQGGLRLRAADRVVELSALRVTVGTKSTLSAVRSGKRYVLLAIDAPRTRRTVDPSGTSITEAPLRLTPAGAERLRAWLHEPALKAGRLGTIDLDADATSSAPARPGAPAPATVTGPPTPGGATLATRPASAISITGGTARWSPRASWLGYLAVGEGASGEAGAGFDGTTYTLPIRDGWFDPATGAAVVNTTGTTRFRFSDHDIDSAYADWSYDLAGPTPKAVATVARDSGEAKKLVGTRQPLALVKLAGITPVVAPGSSATWTDVPLTLSSEGVELYRAYPYDSDQGRLTISATLG